MNRETCPHYPPRSAVASDRQQGSAWWARCSSARKPGAGGTSIAPMRRRHAGRPRIHHHGAFQRAQVFSLQLLLALRRAQPVQLPAHDAIMVPPSIAARGHTTYSPSQNARFQIVASLSRPRRSTKAASSWPGWRPRAADRSCHFARMLYPGSMRSCSTSASDKAGGPLDGGAVRTSRRGRAPGPAMVNSPAGVHRGRQRQVRRPGLDRRAGAPALRRAALAHTAPASLPAAGPMQVQAARAVADLQGGEVGIAGEGQRRQRGGVCVLAVDLRT